MCTRQPLPPFPPCATPTQHECADTYPRTCAHTRCTQPSPEHEHALLLGPQRPHQPVALAPRRNVPLLRRRDAPPRKAGGPAAAQVVQQRRRRRALARQPVLGHGVPAIEGHAQALAAAVRRGPVWVFRVWGGGSRVEDLRTGCCGPCCGGALWPCGLQAVWGVVRVSGGVLTPGRLKVFKCSSCQGLYCSRPRRDGAHAAVLFGFRGWGSVAVCRVWHALTGGSCRS